MAPRASWKGQLRLSLVSFPIRLHNALTSTGQISLNQLHRDCGRRLRQQMICPEHGPVDRSEIAKGYEFEKDKYVLIDDSDLEKIKIETQKTIELLQFIDADELDPIYHENYYFVGPDGPVAQDAFRVIREAMARNKKVGIGRVVMSNREHIVALWPEGQGFMLATLRYADEVRAAAPYFEDIRQGDVDAAHLKLAEQLIENHTAPLDMTQFKDRYQEALLAVIRAKIEGSEPIVAQEEQAGQVINLMDALKASVQQADRKKPPAPSIKPAKAAKAGKTKRA